MIPVSALVGLPGFEPTAVTLERRAAPTTADAYGVPVEPAVVSSTITVVMHPADRKQLVRANLDHATDALAFYSTVELRTSTDGHPDIIVTPDGERWELHNVGDYGTLGGIWIGLGVRFE